MLGDTYESHAGCSLSQRAGERASLPFGETPAPGPCNRRLLAPLRCAARLQQCSCSTKTMYKVAIFLASACVDDSDSSDDELESQAEDKLQAGSHCQCQ